MAHILSATLTILILLLGPPLEAAPQFSFKIATLAPEGSVWITHFRNFAEEVREKTGGDVELKVYPGGVMGDDLAMYRKIRAGQLHGGGFTMTGISEVIPDFRVISIPFFVDDYEEVDGLLQELRPSFEEQFRDKGLELLAITEVGFVYVMSTTPTATVGELRQRKSWVPAGDPQTAAFLDNLGVNPIPLAIPDVLSSLQTGLIDTIYSPLYGAIVMQWFTKTKYVTDIPYGYAYGAVVLSKKTFSRLPPDYAEIVRSAANTHFAALNEKTRQTNLESKKVLEEQGVTFIPPPPDALAVLHKTRDETIPELLGKTFSTEIFAKAEKALEKVRGSNP